MKFIQMTIVFSCVIVLSLNSCSKKDEMSNPQNVKKIKAGTNYLLEKIKYKGNVRWYSIELKKGKQVQAKVSVSDKLGVQLHIDLMRDNGKGKPILIKQGVDKGVNSMVTAGIPEDGIYLLRIFDLGMDEKISGLLKGYTLYVRK